MKRQFVLSLIFFALTAAQFGFAQANVNEALETAIIYVDGTNGSDSNIGSSTQPFKTVSKAADVAASNNRAGIGTKVLINPGTYRESIVLDYWTSDTSQPMTFQAVTPGSVIMSGATLYPGWVQYSPNPSIYSNTWNYQWGLCPQNTSCPYQQDIVLRQEMIIVNGKPLTQVLTMAAMAPGTFMVDTQHSVAYVWPAAGTDMNAATVEVATSPQIWYVQGKHNVVLRGLVFQYANSCHGDPAVEVAGGSDNILIDNVVFQWNNGQGLAVNGTNFTVQNSISNHNGDSGFQEANPKNGWYESDTAAYNNWRGAQGSYYGCNTAGAHFWQSHTDTINNMTLAYNQTYGVHWDTDNKDITTNGFVVTDNLMAGVYLEKDQGPITINTAHICDQNSPIATGGLVLRDSENASLTNSTLVNNTYQINLIGILGGQQITDWETGQVYNLLNDHFTNTNNTIQANGSQQVFRDHYLGGTDWTTFQTTLISNNNVWWAAGNSTPWDIPTPKNGSLNNLTGWQGATGQDTLSRFGVPSGDPEAGCAFTPDFPDYWVTVDSDTVTTDVTGKAVYNVTVTPLTFTGTVNFTLDGISQVSGLSASIVPSSLNTSGNAVLTVTASPGTTAGTYPVTVLATSGNTTHVVTSSLVVGEGAVFLSASSLAFPDTQKNYSSPPQSFTIANNSNQDLLITSIVSSSTSFVQTNNCGTYLSSGQSCTVTVTFIPSSSGSKTGTITITDSDMSSPQSVSLSGNGLANPTTTITPNPFTFPNQGLGSSSAAQKFTVTNTSATSSAALVISSVTLTGANPGDYSLTHNCPSNLAVNATCTVTVIFTPTASGSRKANISVNDNESSGYDTDSLTGTGDLPTLSLAPTTLAFGTVGVGASSALVDTITNTSTTGGVLTITSVSLGGSYPGDYAVQSNNCIASLRPNATCAVTIGFAPGSNGSRNATLYLYGNMSGGSKSLSLTGSGALPSASFTPSPLAFGTIGLGGSSTKTATLTNSSTNGAVLSITSFGLGGSYPQDYSQSNNCPASLNPNASCTITVKFTPGATGSRNATLYVYSNVSGGSKSLSLTGTGAVPSASFTPSPLAFGSVGTPGVSSTKTATLTNSSTNGGVVTITGFGLGGSFPQDYAQTNNCPASLNPNASCTVTVTFTPGGSGSRNATLYVYGNVSGGSKSLSLTGSGSLPTASLSPNNDSFGSITVGVSSSKTSTLTNTSTNGAILNIGTMSFSGLNPGDFSQTNTCPSSLSPNGSCTITVTFIPQAIGSRSATLTVNANTSAGNKTITLSGTGK